MTDTPLSPLSDDDIETSVTTDGAPLAEQDADGVDHGQDADTEDHGGGTDTDSTDAGSGHGPADADSSDSNVHDAVDADGTDTPSI